MRLAIFLLGLLSLTGCAGSPLGDAIASPEVLAQRDDTYCRSIGAVPGTQDYMNCRLTVTQNRANKLAAANAGLLAATASAQFTPIITAPPPALAQPMPSPIQQSVHCQSIRIGNTTQTDCR